MNKSFVVGKNIPSLNVQNAEREQSEYGSQWHSEPTPQLLIKAIMIDFIQASIRTLSELSNPWEW